MKYLEEYYKNLCESLQNQIDLLEKKIEKKKKAKDKPADKDYDGDGEVETSKQEWKGSRDKAIKAKKAQQMKEGFILEANDIEILVDLFESVFDPDDYTLLEQLLEEKKKWIQKAIKKEGSLRKSLKVKSGEKIPLDKLKKAANAPGKKGKRARLALTLRKLNEESGQLDHEDVAHLFLTNSYDGTDFGPEHYRLLPNKVHNQVMGLVGNELKSFIRAPRAEIVSGRPNLSKSVKDLRAAIEILKQHGMENHPAVKLLSHMHTEYFDAESHGEYMSDRARGMHNPQ